MADYFDSYLKGIQAKAYQAQLSKAAETDQAMRAMYGVPQQVPKVGGFLGMGQHPDPSFQPMTPQEGEATARAIAPQEMQQYDVNQQRVAGLKEQNAKLAQDRSATIATATLDAIDRASQIEDEQQRADFWKNTAVPTIAEQDPQFAQHLQDAALDNKSLADARAQMLMRGAKDPNSGRQGQQWGNTATPLTDDKGNVIGFAQAGQGGVRGVPTSAVMSTINPDQPSGNVRLGVKPTAVDTGSQVSLIGPGGSNQGVLTKDLPPQEEPTHKQEVAQATARGTGEETRLQLVIDEGRDAAKGIPTIRRALELMDSVKTGGFANAALNAKAAFGVQGANEAELSSALGEAVLKDLRRTFGAAFTAKEGDKLEAIRAQFGASPEANRRLMQQALAIAEGASKRAMKEASDSGDYRSAANIKETMEQSLSNPGQQSAPTPDGWSVKRKQ